MDPRRRGRRARGEIASFRKEMNGRVGKVEQRVDALESINDRASFIRGAMTNAITAGLTAGATLWVVSLFS